MTTPVLLHLFRSHKAIEVTAKKQPSIDSAQPASSAGDLIGQAILPFIAKIPASKEPKSKTPAVDARKKANAAAANAAMAAGALALPPGPLGWLTILPEMVGVWRIQKQLVVDIAAIYGQQTTLTPEQVVYCLFQHTATQGLRDLVVRVGQRTLVRRASPLLFRSITRRIGSKLAQRSVGKAAARWIPIVGALGVGAYAYYDTAQVAATAIALFEGEIEVDAVALDT
jgi:hypothetical protein